MRGFDASDLASVRPEQVRLAGKVDPAPLVIDLAKSHLALILTSRADSAPDVVYEFDLRTAPFHEPQL